MAIYVLCNQCNGVASYVVDISYSPSGARVYPLVEVAEFDRWKRHVCTNPKCLVAELQHANKSLSFEFSQMVDVLKEEKVEV